ncbi:hypothetical protein MAR_038085 [Mya arenaria]|uniref:Uncharacterized protein n=1 Tax=Mya arenaria TaxID=6604 RepID=A0ABY7FZ85_MYAAR|nr:hypothetical protein MAR_038085 [Mya arenaria]
MFPSIDCNMFPQLHKPDKRTEIADETIRTTVAVEETQTGRTENSRSTNSRISYEIWRPNMRQDVIEIVEQYNNAFNLNLDMNRANMMAISPDVLDKSGNILLRPFLANLSRR